MAKQSFNLAMTPEQFDRTKAALLQTKDVTAHTENDSHSGTFSTSQVTMSYAYDGASNITLTVLVAHGMAKFAPLSTIQAHVEALLATEA